MSDQKKWFKLWTSILSDDDFNPDDHGLLRLGRFCLLGAYLALHGNKGVAVISEKLLLRYTQCDNIDTLRADFMHKNIVFEECKNRHGKITVTFHKWVKYQEDSTQAKRQQVSRSKKRREEKRGEEKRKEEKFNGKQSFRTTDTDDDFITAIKQNIAYKEIDIDKELAKMDAWFLTPKGKGRKKTRRFIINWLNKIDTTLIKGDNNGERSENDRNRILETLRQSR